jgi:hypothetical protein
VGSSISFVVHDIGSGVDTTTLDVYLKQGTSIWELVVSSGIAQTGYGLTLGGTLTDTTVAITHTSNFAYNSNIQIRIVVADLAANELDTGIDYSDFTTELRPPPPDPTWEHVIKYNIYYRPLGGVGWILANNVPRPHNIEGNVYWISNLTEGVVYEIGIIAGIVEDGDFVPLMPQALHGAKGVGDLDTIFTYPVFRITPG